MTDAPAIEVKGLDKTYRDGLVFRRSFAALRDVSFRVNRGEIFGLLGPNGAGKTTFVKVMLGIVRKTRGTAQLLGRPAGDRAGRRRVGYLPENLRVPAHHNAVSALRFFGELSGMSGAEVRQREGKLLESVNLADRLKDSVKKYSKGMLQRLGLAVSLLHDPDLLFLDEPTDGLDPVGRAHVREVLQELKSKGKTIFLNSHLLQEVEMVCDRVAILHQGQLLRIGTVDELLPHHSTGIELDLHLGGSQEAVRLALQGRKAQALMVVREGVFHTRVRAADQGDVDQFVDMLRQRGISIISLTRHRVRLEDAFLELLREAAIVS